MGKTIEIKVPDIGDFTGVPVIEVLVAAGDRVEAEDSLITLESDKATMEIPSPETGVIREMKVSVNDAVSQGDVVAVLELESEREQEPAAEKTQPAASETARREAETDAAGRRDTPVAVPKDDVPAAADSKSEAAHVADVSGPPAVPGIRRGAAAVDPALVPYASPAVRQFARELGVDLAKVRGSGGGGRILKEDVAGFVKSVMTSKAEVAPAAPSAGLPFSLPPAPQVDFSRFGAVSEKPLSRIRKIAAGHLHRNWIGIPHVTQHDEADITDMEAFRKENSPAAEKQGFKLTPLVFLIKASVAALKNFPDFNSSLETGGERLIMKGYFNIGIAVDTADGLVVPVLRDCDRKGIMELAKELAEISQRAREQKLKPQDIQGGCFSISSLGGIGGTAFTPIINAPEVAILGVSRSRMAPVWNGKEFRPRLMLPLSLSYDHRVIDGANAARFTRYLASRLEDLRLLAL